MPFKINALMPALTQKLSAITSIKFAFGKSNNHAFQFARSIGAASMYDVGLGLNIPQDFSNEYSLRAVFVRVNQLDGVFIFNVSGVDLKRARKGFANYEYAEQHNLITEWELSTILSTADYKKKCIFHNGQVEFKKTLLWKAVK